jgi:ABC-type multidrug transport system fused ATPase/permease subunit
MRFKDLETILFFQKKYKRYVISVLMLSVLYAVFEGLNVAVLFPIINSFIKTDVAAIGGGSLVGFLNRLIEFIPVKDVFIGACILVIIIVVLKNIFRYLYMVLGAYSSYKVWEDAQRQLYGKYINADYRYFLDHKHGEIVYRLDYAPGTTGAILKLIPQFITELLKILVICAILLSMSFSVTCGVIFLTGIFYFFTRNISKKISYFLGKGRMEATEQQNILINEMINGIKQIKVFLGEKLWISRFYEATGAYFKLAQKDTLWINMPISALEIFALTVLSVFLIFVKRFSPQSLILNLPLIGVFAYAFQRVMPSLSLITSLKMQIMGDLPVLETLRSIMNEEMSCMKDGDKIIASFDKNIEFRNVSFSYPNRAHALDNASVSFEKNRCIAIVGPSGSGKTTMVNLLIRLFDPTQGVILIDGIDIRDYKKSSWLNRIGFVSQDTFMFHSSVYDNIAFGVDSVDIEDVIAAAKTANAHDFILKLPNGYNTIVGEKGMKLSGGEQQRIAIARAMLRNPQILIFDEATSALDNTSQSLIQNAINGIVRDHTVILIAHRLSTIVNADKIIVLDGGIIRETGIHSELIAKKGYYWNLYNREAVYA